MASSSSKRKRRCSESDTNLDDTHHHEDPSQDSRPNKREKAQTPETVPLPPVSRNLPIVLGASHWYGRGSFENIVIFGASYSKWHEGRTWVDFLRGHMQRQGFSSKIHNFAFPGATVEDNLWDQLCSFTKFKESNDNGSALVPDRTTYVIFMGINDCGKTECDELDSIVEKIFDTLQDLYVKVRARNFILIDVPPVDRSPQAVDSEVTEVVEERVKTWNDLLREQATEFRSTNKDGTLFLFSSHQLLMDVLDDPLEYDFTEDDVTTEAGGIWADDLHLTSEVHDILGEQLLKALAIQFEGTTS